MSQQPPEDETSEESSGAGEIPPTVARTPVVLLLDKSRSMRIEVEGMNGEEKRRIDHVNEGLELFKQEIMEDFAAKTRVSVCIVTFGEDDDEYDDGVTVRQDFTPIQDWEPPTLDHEAYTPMGKGIDTAITQTEKRKDWIKQQGVPYNRPLIWMLTDGAPTDMSVGDQTWNAVQDLLEEGTKDERLLFYAVGVGEEADIDVLEELVSVVPDNKGGALQLDEGDFAKFFKLVSRSASRESDPDEDHDGSLPSQK